MPRQLDGHMNGSGLRIGIIAARFNSYITDRMLEQTLFRLQELGVCDPDITVARVPGAFEIPVPAAAMARCGNNDSLICIGAVIKGETANFDLICNAITNGIMQISVNEKKPIGNAILTCLNKNQAKDRFDRGAEAAKAIISVLKI